jgi:hypothetical protein
VCDSCPIRGVVRIVIYVPVIKHPTPRHKHVQQVADASVKHAYVEMCHIGKVKIIEAGGTSFYGKYI